MEDKTLIAHLEGIILETDHGKRFELCQCLKESDAQQGLVETIDRVFQIQ